MDLLKTNLEQWRYLQAVIDLGGYAQAAQALHRSQSAISYAISRLQQQLGVNLLEIQGRKAVLTEAGEILLRRARQLLSDAQELEQISRNLQRGWEGEIQLFVDEAFPTQYLIDVLQAFSPLSRGSRIHLNEVVVSGALEALEDGVADLVITPLLPVGFAGDILLTTQFIAVAAQGHPLHQQDKSLTHKDLSRERQVVVRDSARRRKHDIGWLGAEQRWTVSNIATAITLVEAGMGFSWLPESHIQKQLASGQLKPLPLSEGSSYPTHFHLVFGQRDQRGPATQQLAQLFREHTPAT